MAREVINVGAAPNDGTGDPIRTSFIKCNDNFGELYARAQTNPPSTAIGTLGDQAGMYAYDSNYFYYCFGDYNGVSPIWAQVTNIGNIAIPQILNGSSSVDIPVLDGNITVTVSNIANVAVFTSDGIEAANIAVTGTLNVTGISTMGHVLPAVDATYDLGSPGQQWHNLYLTGNTIYLGSAEFESNATSVTITTGSGSQFVLGGSGPDADIIGGNVDVSGSISAAGNITAAYVLGNISTTTGGYGNADMVANLAAFGSNPISTSGNITSGNFNAAGNVTGGNLTTTGNVDSGNVNTGIVYASGNIQTTGGLFIGNGAGLFGVVASANVGSAQKIENGSSDLNVVGAGGNIVGNINGFTNLFEFSTVGFSASGNITGNYILGNGSQLTGLPQQYGNSNVAAYLSTYTGNISAGNISSGTVSTTGNITGAYILGNGSQLTGLPQQYGNSNVAAYLPTYTGNLAGGNVSVTGNIQTTNLIIPNSGKLIGDFSNSLANGRSTFQTSATGTFSPTYISIIPGALNTFDPETAITVWTTDSSSLNTGISLQAYSTDCRLGTIITGAGSYLPITVYNGGSEVARFETGGNVGIANIAPVDKLSVGGNAYFSNNLVAKGNITANYISVSQDINVSGTIYGTFSGNIAGNLVVPGSNTQVIFNNAGNAGASADFTFNDGTNVLTLNGTTNLITLSASGNVTGANLITSGLATITGNVTGGNLITTGLITVTGNVQGGNLRTAGLVSATGNVDGGNLRTAGLISATGNITGGNLTVSTGTISVGNIVNTNSNGIGNIGTTGTRFNTVFALASSAQYADLAEYYLSDADYAPGTVVKFGGNHEITQADIDQDPAVAGVVSENPAYEMNAGLEGDHVLAVALVGRVKCWVKGPVRRGQMMVSAGNGYARAEITPAMGTVIGKALQDFDGDTGTIEVVVGRL